MLSHHHTSPSSAHVVASPSPSPSSSSSHPQRRDAAHAMLRNVDTILAEELHTLRRLQGFYEQHTFDTQGPYADLFAVLLSSCKHVIDINAQLVQHIRSQEEMVQRQQATCDVLCGEAAQHKSDIAALYAGLARVTNAMHMPEDQAAVVMPHSATSSATTSASSSASSSTAAVNNHHSSTGQRGDERKSSAAPRTSHQQPRHDKAVNAEDREDAFSRRAWVQAVERRLVSLQEQLSAAVHHNNQFHQRRSSSRGSSTASEKQSAPLAAATAAATATAAADVATEHENAMTADALWAHLDKWKCAIEDTLGDRVDHLAHQMNTLDSAVRQQQRRLRWMSGTNAGENGSAAADAGGSPDTRRIARKRLDLPEHNLEAPPTGVTQWLHRELQQREEAWRRVLEDVQEALMPPVHTQLADPPAADCAQSASMAVVTTQTDRASSSPGSFTPAMLTGHARFVDTIQRLLTYTDTAKRDALAEELKGPVQRAEEQLRDVVARLEVLEVYAPHRYATSTRPPVLGVELEDVAEPRAGVRVCAVYQGYLADRAGLSLGDVIAGVGQESIHTRAQLYVVLSEMTRDYNAQCRVQIEEGFMRHYAASPGNGPVDTSILTEFEVVKDADREGDGSSSFMASLQRARAEAAKAGHRLGQEDDLRFRRGASARKSASAFSFPSAPQHRELLAQCLPYFELTLHVIRDGRLRDVTLLVPPADALRSVIQY